VIGKVLVANRGEVALRVIRACRELNIPSVAVYSTADEDSLHRLLADEAICIGPPQAAGSYLNIPAIISAAELTGADAIHPGYGFLAENARFAEICEACNIKFVGPSSEAIALMGDKANARRVAAAAGVPITPGSDGLCRSAAEVKRVGSEVGYPLVIKASAGGGGKGMRVVYDEGEGEAAYVSATREAAVGGDLLDVVPTDDGVRLLIGDVRGKGLEAVRLSAMMLSSFRDKALTVRDLSRVAELLEVRLTPHLGPEDFITAVLAEIGWDGRLELRNCAHPPPLLIRDGEVQPLEPPVASTPFGLSPDPEPVVLQLRAGDRMLFYTDGLIEARSRSDRGFVPLTDLTRTLGSDDFHLAVDTVLDRLRAAVGGQLDDDLALLLTEFGGPT
jgi:hypothetical protein